MITFERTRNYRLIREVLVHPKIWPFISDDASPPVEEFQPVEHDAFRYILAYCDDTLLGLWMFVPQNGVCWEVHTALLPVAWGLLGQSAAKALPGWIWENTPCRRIVTNVPSSNRLALHFALKAGMKIYGVNEGSYLKAGILRDQVCLGISKPRVQAAKREDSEEELMTSVQERA